MIYLDWAATTPPTAPILKEMEHCAAEYYGNPSSLHAEGRKAAAKREEYRSRCAAVLGCDTPQIVFTSGGTESNNMITSSLYSRRDRGRIIVSGIEHPAVWNPVQTLARQGWEIKVINPSQGGLIRPEKLAKLITEETKMVLIMGLHNESGVIQPLAELVKTVREAGTKRPIHFHSDLVQAAGKIPLNLKELDLDSASFSAHKLQGPRGSGLLYVKKALGGLYEGGGQEGGLRPGTENLAGIAGMTLAFEKSREDLEKEGAARERMLRLMEGIREIPGALLLPEGRYENATNFSSRILSCAFPPLPGEVLVRVMDEAGFCISTGSACSSNRKSRTRALEAMGVSAKTAFSSIRISQGPDTTDDEIDALLDALREQSAQVGRAVR
jgi:cysteine desulfurase